jgi:hypothetical protein
VLRTASERDARVAIPGVSARSRGCCPVSGIVE